MVTAEGCRDGFLAMIDELGEDFVILQQFTPASAEIANAPGGTHRNVHSLSWSRNRQLGVS
jgi:hypothetical protein